jgi:hypothetical protein
MLLAAVANTLMKANPEKLKGMEGNVARLLLCVVVFMTPTCRPHAPGKHPPGDQVDYRATSSLRCCPNWKAGFCHEASSRQGQRCFTHVSGSGRNQEARGEARICNRGVWRAHPLISNPFVRVHSMCQVISSMSIELVVEDVRALCVLLSKHIEEMNRERSQTAMNGT